MYHTIQIEPAKSLAVEVPPYVHALTSGFKCFPDLFKLAVSSSIDKVGVCPSTYELPFRSYIFCYSVDRHGYYLQVLCVSAHASLARGALEVDVLEHALDMVDGGVDARGHGFNLHGDGVQTAVQRRETLPCPVLIVPEGHVCPFDPAACVGGTACLLPGVILQVMHVLLMFIHENRNVVQLHLQVHHLEKTRAL